MGSSQSRPVTASPSAAFGRLRIDSPAASIRGGQFRRPSKVTSSLRNLAGVLVAAEHVSASEESPLIWHRLDSISSEKEIIAVKAPALYIWIGPALVCSLMYALYNICIKKGSASIHPILGGVILQFVAAILGTGLLLVILTVDGSSDMNYDREGIQYAILAGASVGAAEILSFIVSGMGVQAMQSIPIIIGGSVLFGTVLGYTVLQEMLTYRGWMGVGLIAAGITLVGTDPGGAGSVH